MSLFKLNIFLCSMIISLTVTGCVTMDQKLSHPVTKPEGSAGELYLSVTAGKSIVHESGKKRTLPYSMTGQKPKVRATMASPPRRENLSEKWVVVTEKTDTGKKLGVTVSPLVQSDLISEALSQKLSAAGYTVRLVDKLPEKVGKGINLARASVNVEQVSGLLAIDGSCRLRISIELWRKGAKLKKIEDEFSYSDYALSDRDQLVPDMLNTVIQMAMKQSIPEIVKDLEN